MTPYNLPQWGGIEYMQRAYQQACLAHQQDEIPVGAVIVKGNRIIAQAHNLVQFHQNATHHAEMLCVQQACAKMNEKYLIDCDIYVTLEPCSMCAGALSLVKIRRIYFGAYDPKNGGIDHTNRTLQYMPHQPEVYGGILEEKCKILLKQYFAQKRI